MIYWLTALLAPFTLLLPVGTTPDVGDGIDQPANAAPAQPDASDRDGAGPGQYSPDDEPQGPGQWPFRFVSRSFAPPSAWQVRIEESITVRISPRARGPVGPPMRPDVFMDPADRSSGPRMIERRMGKCVPITSIAGVQTAGGGALILYLRDRRMVRAELERSCRSQDFYSGFYLSRSADGQLCVDRDSLQSRSGANCKLTRMRQLVEVGN